MEMVLGKIVNPLYKEIKPNLDGFSVILSIFCKFDHHTTNDVNAHKSSTWESFHVC